MDKIPLKNFLEAVEQRLSSCSSAELRAILRAMAQQTAPTDRQEFLQKLQPPNAFISSSQKPDQTTLLDEIADLEADLQEVMETVEPDEWEGEWYGEPEEENEDPYEEFLEPLSRLFDQAQAAFDYGNLKLARDAYQALFDLCAEEDEYGGGIQTEYVAGLDREEALARYLYAVYTLAPTRQRPEQLFEAMSQVHIWNGKPFLFEQIIQISIQPLPGLDDFWPKWISFLKEQTGRDADIWLRETIRLTQGTSGLADLARSLGVQHPMAYLDWLAALEQEQRFAEALSAAQEALQTLPRELPIRAAIAEHLCASAMHIKDMPVLRAGRWEAFWAAPDLPRLLNMRDAAPDTERLQEMLRAYQYLQEYRERPRNPSQTMFYEDPEERPTWVNQNLLTNAMLLSGNWAAAQQKAATEPVLGWSSSESTQGMVLVFFLVWLSGNATPSGNLAGLWRQRLQASEFDSQAESPLVKRLEDAYKELFSQISLDTDQQATILAWCLETANRRVDAIVSGQHRGSYDKAALLITACAEVLRLRGEKEHARDLLSSVRERYPRHRSFQTEMNKVSGV